MATTSSPSLKAAALASTRAPVSPTAAPAKSVGALKAAGGGAAATSFNTDRDRKGVHPGKQLEEKLQNQVRRSSHSEDKTSFKKKESEGRGLIRAREGEEDERFDGDEPMAPRPDRPQSSVTTGSVDDTKKAPVILTSKPVFSNYYKSKEGNGGSTGEE